MKIKFALRNLAALSLLLLFSCTSPRDEVLPQNEKETPEVIAAFEWSARYNDAQGFPHHISRKLENIKDLPDEYKVDFTQSGDLANLTITCLQKSSHCEDGFSFHLRFVTSTTGGRQLEPWGEVSSNSFMVEVNEDKFGSTNGLLQITYFSDTHIEGNFHATCFHLDDTRVTPIISGKFNMSLK